MKRSNLQRFMLLVNYGTGYNGIERCVTSASGRINAFNDPAFRLHDPRMKQRHSISYPSGESIHCAHWWFARTRASCRAQHLYSPQEGNYRIDLLEYRFVLDDSSCTGQQLCNSVGSDSSTWIRHDRWHEPVVFVRA